MKGSLVELQSGARYDTLVEYYEGIGDASVKLEWYLNIDGMVAIERQIIPTAYLYPSGQCSVPQGKGTGLDADYYNGILGSGAPVLVHSTIDSTINFNWYSTPPMYGVNADEFSIHWRGRLIPSVTGEHQICAVVDDGFKLSIDGYMLIDAWINQGATEYCGSINLEKDKFYDIDIKYYDYISLASFILTWKNQCLKEKTIIPSSQLCFAPIGAGTGLKGKYKFPNVEIERIDSKIDFNWGLGKPIEGTGTQEDDFTVNWQGRLLPFWTGEHTICANVDDGIQLSIDGTRHINFYQGSYGTKEHCVKIQLVKNQFYTIEIQYMEVSGPALIQLTWEHGCQTKTVIPQSQLYLPA